MEKNYIARKQLPLIWQFLCEEKSQIRGPLQAPVCPESGGSVRTEQEEPLRVALYHCVAADAHTMHASSATDASTVFIGPEKPRMKKISTNLHRSSIALEPVKRTQTMLHILQSSTLTPRRSTLTQMTRNLSRCCFFLEQRHSQLPHFALLSFPSSASRVLDLV